jgi:hypothetical protein
MDKKPKRLLNEDERSALGETMESEGYKVVLKLIELCVANVESQIHAMRLQPGAENELILRKARAEGAREAMNKFMVTVEQHRAEIAND